MVCVYRRRTIAACMCRAVTDAWQCLAWAASLAFSLVHRASINRFSTINMTVTSHWWKKLAHVIATCLLLVNVFDRCLAGSKCYLASCTSVATLRLTLSLLYGQTTARELHALGWRSLYAARKTFLYGSVYLHSSKRDSVISHFSSSVNLCSYHIWLRKDIWCSLVSYTTYW